MELHKSVLAGTAAVAITASGLIGATTAPANSADATIVADDPTNTNKTAKRLCEDGAAHDSYETVYVEQKQSLKRWNGDEYVDPDPDIGTLYVVHLADPRYNTRHCAIVIKGGDTDGRHHPMSVGIGNDSTVGGENNDGRGYREQVAGPQYWGHHWSIAWGAMDTGGERYLAELHG